MEDSKKDYKSIVSSEAFPGILLLGTTILALILANTELDRYYNYILYDLKIGEEFNLHVFINDFLMAIFFLVVGCEIKREIVYGKLSNIKEASFPVLAAIGGMLVPALIFTLFNFKSGFEIGAGIPLSTDIAFAIGIFSILESKLKFSLKLFLLTLAVVDDLLSIVIIGVFYSSHIRISGIIISLILIAALFCVRFFNKRNRLYPYLILGLALWIAIFYSGIHSTLSGVILAFSIPVLHEKDRDKDLSYKIEHKFEPFSNFVILPLFAFANAGIALDGFDLSSVFQGVSLAIFLGLVLGKFFGIFSFTFIAIKMRWVPMPHGATWKTIAGVSALGGIGFTVSLFIANLSYGDMPGGELLLNQAKMGILLGSLLAGIIGYTLLNLFLPKHLSDEEL